MPVLASKKVVAIPRTRAKYERESNSKAKWANFEVIQDFMSVLVINKFDQDPIKKKKKVATPGVTCFPL